MRQRTATLSDDASPRSKATFEALYRAQGSAVRRHLTYLTGDAALAEDLAQDTFGRLYERLLADEDARPDNPRAWLLTVASNLAYNQFRTQTRREAREAAEGRAAEASAGAGGADVDAVLDVRSALAKLEARDRMALMLRHSGFSYAEIAEVVSIAPGSVGTILARAQRRFRDVYEGGIFAAEKE